MKKILVIDLGNVWGGQEIYSYNLMKYYKRNNIYIISISSQKRFSDISDEFIEVSSSYKNFLNLTKIIKYYYDDVDIVHFNGNRALYLSFFLKKNKKFVGTKHAPFFIGGKKTIKNSIAQLFGNILFNKLNRIICVANATYNDLPKSIKSKSIVIYNGIDIGSNKYLEKADGVLRICYVARLIQSKGILELLNIIKKLYEYDNIMVHLDIAGDGELKSQVEDFIRFNPKLDIKYHGFLNNPKDIYENSHLGIMLSKFEGMPLNILEAFSAGLPFISYNISGVSEVIVNNYNGFLIKLDDLDSAYQKIKELDYNRDLIVSMSKNANNDFNEKFSLEIMGNTTINLFNRLCNENSN